MNTRLPRLLDDLAAEMPVDVEATAPRTLRRAKIRRAASALSAVAAVLVVILVTVSGLRLLSTNEPTPRTPATPGPIPSEVGFAGLWPETDADALASAQAALDQGRQPVRAAADGTATLFATNLLGWQPGDVQFERSSVGGDRATVVISNRVFGDPVPPITVELRQLGVTGSGGAWSVVGVSTPLIELEEVTGSREELGIFGRVTTLFDAAPALEVTALDGPVPDPALGHRRFELTDRAFSLFVPVGGTQDGRAALLVSVPDATGASLGALMFAIETTTGTPAPAPSVDGVPAQVAVTAQRIYDGAMARDFDALAGLLDPDTFMYDFDDGSDPIPAWRSDPLVLDFAVAVLQLPAAAPRDIEGYGTFYIWPYLIDSDFTTLTDQELADLALLGYSEREIELMVEAGHGYQGPRLAIDVEGLWRSLSTVGE